MQTFGLLEQLSQKPKEEIKFALLSLILNGKIDFIDLNQSYVEALEVIRHDQEDKLIEAETCVLQALTYQQNSKSVAYKDHIQRCLYLLNQSKRFNMKGLNEIYKYNEEVGKAASWYEKKKK